MSSHFRNFSPPIDNMPGLNRQYCVLDMFSTLLRIPPRKSAQFIAQGVTIGAPVKSIQCTDEWTAKQSNPSFSLASSSISFLYSCRRTGSLGPQSCLGLKALKNLSRHVVPGSRITATNNHIGICKTPIDVMIQPKTKNKFTFIGFLFETSQPKHDPSWRSNNNLTKSLSRNLISFHPNG
uniref:Uncharacterized protein n=1 Tax=Glossina pallidipes TaxID=7398 RepID=A0A1B0ADB3_GLOPL